MKKIMLLFIIIIGCNTPKEKDSIILNNNFKKIVASYINSYPIEIIEVWESKEKLTIPHPSYHIVFDKLENDTIIWLKLLPHFSNFNPINFEKQGDSVTVHSEITPNGFFIYNNNPIVVFDLDDYCKNIINKEKLIKEIPDSLKFNLDKLGIHIKSDSEFYKVSKLVFESISLEEINNKTVANTP